MLTGRGTKKSSRQQTTDKLRTANCNKKRQEMAGKRAAGSADGTRYGFCPQGSSPPASIYETRNIRACRLATPCQDAGA